MVASTDTFVPSATAIPPGLNATADGSVSVAATAPARPGALASCSLTLNAFADAIAEEPSVAAKRMCLRFFIVVVAPVLLVGVEPRGGVDLHTEEPVDADRCWGRGTNDRRVHVLIRRVVHVTNEFVLGHG